ncbi:MAG: hypothetical protein CVU48_01290 [Candidatus Cloacimonetes bacterium HGW-Cloacimonetes-1]|nr:MAG: hypothetical protein CVU48_01290 [Candidatus Cloacimonetes bacterium HGW-Cloacimonetes-1]
MSEVIVLRDVSGSMNLKTTDQSKKDYLQPHLDNLIAKYRDKGYKVTDYDFANGISKDKDNSLLAPALAYVAKKHKRIRTVVLGTDAWLKDEDLSIIKQLNVPFITIADTAVVQNQDLAVMSVNNNRQGYRNEPTLIRSEIKADNWKGTATVTLKINGKQAAVQKVIFNTEYTQLVDFHQRFSQTGFYSYSVEVSAPNAKERTLNNNSFPGAIEIQSEKERIIIISDKPGWDNKFIIDAISTNPRWAISHYSAINGQLSTGNKPVSTLENSNLSVIIIINNGELRLGANLANQIQALQAKGIGLLYQGAPIDELNSLPIQKSNVSSSYQGFMRWQAESQNYPMLRIDPSEQANIPPLDYYYVVAKSGTITAITMDNPQKSPALVLMSGPTGKAIAIPVLNLWRWQMQSSSSSYQKLITGAVTWLGNLSTNNFNALYNNSYFRGESVNIRLRVEDSIRQAKLDINPRLEIFDPENKSVFADYMTLDGNDFGASTSFSKAGTYRFEILDKDSGNKTGGKFYIAESSVESRDFDYNLPLLSWIAWESGGKMLDQNSLPAFTPLPPTREQVTIRNEIPLYKKWYILSLFILSFCTELFFRRRWGLL